jgi:glucose/mannose-6-phosphate isomerase
MIERENINLDDPGVYSQFDRQGMLVHIHNFPRLCQQAWQMVMGFTLPQDYRQVQKVVILGMGGSAIGGDLVKSLSLNESGIPVLICRDYNLPQYVDANTLVIASSYSGMTEETLTAFQQSLDTPARKLVVTTGGELKRLCERENVPVFSFDYKTQPRAALPYSFMIILGILQNLGLIQDKSRDVDDMINVLHSLAGRIDEKVPCERNMAKALARKLFGRLPVIYGAGITAEVAHRWKTQINENSKTTAFYEVFSELNHNSVVGYNLPEELTHQCFMVFLHSDHLHERIRLRYEITQNLLDQAGIYYQVVNDEGESSLSRMMSLVLIGDYVSYYLAILNQVDPTPVKSIDYLKDQLAHR